MSLDVSLLGKKEKVACTCSCCGYEHTRIERQEYYENNITHNLGTMAREAGLYEALWRPYRLKEGYDEIKSGLDLEYEFEKESIVYAKDIIPKLILGLDILKLDPNRFKKFNPSNGWGKYETLVSFVESYLNACCENPESEIRVSR